MPTKKILAFYMGPGKRVTEYWSTEAIDGMTKYDVEAQAAYPDFLPATEFSYCPFAPVDVGLVLLKEPVRDVVPEPLDFRVGNVLERLERTRDRWHDVFASKQSLTRAFGSTGRK